MNGVLIKQYLPADYVDSLSKTLDGKNILTVDMLFDSMFCDLPWMVRALLRLRDAMVKPLGLNTGATFRDRILDRNENEIIVAADDKHLSFWVSVYCSAATPSTVSVTTVVKFHNMMGKLYFAGIWMAHKLLVCSLFRRALRVNRK